MAQLDCTCEKTSNKSPCSFSLLKQENQYRRVSWPKWCEQGLTSISERRWSMSACMCERVSVASWISSCTQPTSLIVVSCVITLTASVLRPEIMQSLQVHEYQHRQVP